VEISSIGAWVLAAVFGWASVNKLVGPRQWLRTVGAYRLGRASTGVAVAVPLAELLVPLSVAFGGVDLAAALALALLASFSVGVLRARGVNGDRLPCGCFGAASARDYRMMLARNAVLAVVAGVVVLAPGDSARVVSPVEDDLLPAVLALLGAVAALVTLWRASTALREGRRL